MFHNNSVYSRDIKYLFALSHADVFLIKCNLFYKSIDMHYVNSRMNAFGWYLHINGKRHIKKL